MIISYKRISSNFTLPFFKVVYADIYFRNLLILMKGGEKHEEQSSNGYFIHEKQI